MAANSTTFKPGNTAALKHGLRSTAIRREAVEKLRGKYRNDLLSMKPDLGDIELDLGIDILADLALIRGYIATRGGILMATGQVRKCAGERDRLVGRWNEYCRRVGIGYATRPTSASESLADAEAAQAELRARYQPEASE